MKKNVIALVLASIVISGKNVYAIENITNSNKEEVAIDGDQNRESIETDNLDLMDETIANGEVLVEEEKIEENQPIQEELQLENNEKTEDETIKDVSDSEEIEKNMNKKSRVCLQIPQKLDLMIDPFEINEKGQIYSEEYTIRNAGTEAGILTLSDIACKPGDKSEVNIITENKGMHETGAKSAYVKIVFENEEVVLSQEGAEYKVWLAPGEELRFHYSGEVNENASQNWREGDISVRMIYFWNVEDDLRENIAEEKKEENLEGKPKLPEIMSIETDQLNIKDELDDSEENILKDEPGGDEK